MAKGTKYSIIANSISSFQNPVARRHGAESIMIHALKYILAPELRDWEMPIVCNNTYYMVLKGQFDNTGNTQLVNVFNDPHGIIPVAVKAIVTRPRRKNLKKAKKQVSRVYHDFKRARREGLLGDVGNNYDFAIKSICDATKEAYIITRKRIAPAVHEIIPVVETVALTTGNSSLKDLFVEQQNTTLKGTKNYFALEKEYGFEDSHAIQYKLSTYSFEHIFSNRR